MSKNIIGNIYPITLNKKRIFKGWYAIKGDNGKYYLLERNFSISSNFKRNLYTADESISDLIVTEKQKSDLYNKESKVGILGLTLIIAALARVVIPKDFIFGSNNSTGDYMIGLANIFSASAIVLLGIFIICFYRKKQIKKFLPSLKKAGRVKLKTPLIKLKNGKEFW